MEDTKLKTKFVFWEQLNGKRRGSALILALIVALVGGAVGALIFNVAGSFLHTTSLQSRVYTDDIIVGEYIETAKARVMSVNRSRHASGKTVLHSSANDSYGKFIKTDFTTEGIVSIDALIISPDELGIQMTHTVDKGLGPRYVELEVLDAAYNPKRLVPGFIGLSNLPPSFFTDGGAGAGFTGDNEEEQNLYAAPPGGSSGSVSSLDFLPGIYSNDGVYLVRVKIYSDDSKGALIRTTEEAFADTMP